MLMNRYLRQYDKSDNSLCATTASLCCESESPFDMDNPFPKMWLAFHDMTLLEYLSF